MRVRAGPAVGRPGRTGKYANGARAPSGPPPRARALRRAGGAGHARPGAARAPRGPRARQGGGPAARDQRRDDGRGLHLGQGLGRRPLRAARAGGHSRRATSSSATPTAFVAMSGAIRREFLAAGMPEERVALIPHGVDTERFRPATADERAALCAPGSRCPRRRRSSSTRAASCAARVSRPSVRGLSEVARPGRAGRLLIVGSGAGQALSVEDELRRRRGSRASRAVSSSRDASSAVEDYLRAADVFAFPSVFEGAGHLPRGGGGLRPARRGEPDGRHRGRDRGRSDGLLVPPGDARALEDALAASWPMPGWREAMGARARERALRLFDVARA